MLKLAVNVIAARRATFSQPALGEAKIYEPAEVFSQLMNRAESKDAEAQNHLGLCFQFGYGAGQDYKKAAVWFRRAAEAGLATAQFNLAVSSFEGKGLAKSFGAAPEWYTGVAERRDQLALLQWGRIYPKGISTEINLKRAFIL